MYPRLDQQPLEVLPTAMIGIITMPLARQEIFAQALTILAFHGQLPEFRHQVVYPHTQHLQTGRERWLISIGVISATYIIKGMGLFFPWYNGVLNDVNVTAPALSPPPAPGAPAPVIPIQPLVTTVIAGATTSAYTRFLTPLCKRCEVFEKQVYWERMVGDVRPGMVPGVDEPMLRRDPEGWPHNTCTCWGGLEGPSGLWACMECRHLRAMELHDERLIMRQQNDYWLREKRVTRDGRIQQAPPQQRTKRERVGAFRICRCGKEIIRKNRGYTPPDVYMCLGCEGVRHVGAYVFTQARPPGLPPLTRATDPMGGRVFRLRRI
ncbi:hypothetical protein NU195Hw_Modified_320t1 [Hortaea werneckii]